MSVEECRQAVEKIAGRCEVEVSGSMNLETVAAYAATGVERISNGSLTHSAPSLDFSLLLKI